MSNLRVTKQEYDKMKQNQKKNASNTDSKLINVNETLISTIQAEQDCVCDDQPEKASQKLTYSAQHQTPHLGYQQTNLKSTSAMANNQANIESAAYPHYNAIPLYQVSSGKMNQGQNLPINHMHYPFPCSGIPPPVPPPTDDLWDLQFCRWWGWNWVRKREEMLKKKRAAIKMKSNASGTSESKKRKSKKKKAHRKQDDFFTWWNKLFKKQHKKPQLKTEEKKQLQNLYETPCSSVTFNNNCPCPVSDWECRSIKLEGDYECYCSSSGKTSLSTILVRNKTRRQACKQHKRKHQSWVFEKTDTSSSEEYCPCMNLCPHRGESSADESVEYLSLRMAHVKSDSEDNIEYHPCVRIKECKKNIPKPVCCPCKAQKKDVYYGCPYKIKFICERQNKPPKQRCIVREYPVRRQHHHCHEFKRRDNSPSPCRSWPVCKVPPPVKVPRLCKPSPVIPICKPFPQFVRRCKRKYIPEPCCQRNKEYILYCPCQCPPRKRIKKCKKPKKVYHCCCCCCCCNNKIQPGHQSESTENSKMMRLGPSEDLEQTAIKNTDCTHTNIQNNNMNNVNPNQTLANNAQPYAFCLQKNQEQENCICGLQPVVSKALDKGLYTSPLTGKTYTLNPKIFFVNEIQNQNNLPKPFDLNEKIFNAASLPSPLVDEEHKCLLNAVCEAILSSRVVKKDTNKFLSSPSPYSEILPNDLWGNLKITPLVRHRKPRIVRAHNVSKDREHYLTQQNSDELLTHNYESDETDNTYELRDMEHNRCENLSTSQFVPFAISEKSKYNGLNYPTTEIPKSKYKIFENDSGNPNVNTTNFTLASQDKLAPNAATVSADARKCKNLSFPDRKSTEVSKSTNVRSRRTRIPIRVGNRKLLTPKRFSNAVSEQKLLNSMDIPVSFNSLQKEYPADFTNLKNKPYNNICDATHEIAPSTLQKLNKNNGNDHLNLTFNSPRNWITPPKFPGVSLTGLISSVSDIGDTKGHSSIENKYKINAEHFKKRKIYDIFFANNKPDFCEDFPNVPINFSPAIPPPSCLINHLPSCPLVLRELPVADVSQATQTQGHDVSTSAEISKTESEKELQCVNLTQENKPCGSEPKATATRSNACPKSQKPICPREAGVNTAISCVREILQYTDPAQANEISQNTLFTKENQSEKEICCTNFHQETPKKIFLPLHDIATLTETITKDSECGPESTCVYLQHNQQNFKFLKTPDPPRKNLSEKLVSVINRISEESVSDLLSETDLHSHASLSETSSFLSFLQATNKESAGNSSVLTEHSSPFSMKYSQTYTQNPIVNTTTSPFKIKYATRRKDDRPETEYYSRRKVQRKESPFSMFCVPVLSKNVHSRPGSDRDSISRPERKMIVAKTLKEREKRWRY
ncbi:hypothetical protein ILUMI_13231 [Ignelater luminosus]|uniref:Uncharacterized protein n=1 Tax=Ignelater luminosus TaxID=2038154 RepID=A0A8K0CX40_IGNLU|nr:hypothetical protein ILUMI_13231 [Ignelater luminosus]